MAIARRELLKLGAAGALIAAAPRGTAGSIAMVGDNSPAGLREHLAGEMARAGIPGMQVAVIRQDQLVFFETLGLADVENSVPASNSTVFQIASCTKAFVGVAVMQLVEDGKLDLDAPLIDYISGFPSEWRTVTVGQVATHMSGLPDIAADFNLHLIVPGDADASWSRVQTMPLEFTPGDKFSYNQSNYVALGKIIDVVAGVPFIQFIQERQLDVVGMRRTVFGDDHDVVPRSARTYTPYISVDGQPTRTDALYKTCIEFPPILRACGGLNSTAEEIARWLLALRSGSLLRNEASLTSLLTARRLNDGRPGPWGIGGWVIDRPRHPAFFAVGAAKSAFAIYPDDSLGVIVLTNLSADMQFPFVDEIAGFYLPASDLAASRRQAQIS